MRKVTQRLLVASLAALAVGACQDSISIVEPAPTPPPPPPPGEQVEPSIVITSVTQGNLNTPVNPNAVVGLVNFTISAEPGSGNQLQEVWVELDGVKIASQSFAGSGALAPSSDVSLSGSADPQTAVLSYDSEGVCGSVNNFIQTGICDSQGFVDGFPVQDDVPATVTAHMRATGGTTVATQGLELQFDNGDDPGDIFVRSCNTAEDAADEDWWGGETDCEIVWQPVWRSTTAPNATCTISDGFDLSNSNDRASLDEETNYYVFTLPWNDSDNDQEVMDVLFDCDNGTVTNDETFNFDFLEPPTPVAADFSFEDDRFDNPVNQYPVNDWANGSTVFGVREDLDLGVGMADDLAFEEAVFDGFLVEWSGAGTTIMTGADLDETNGGGDVRLILESWSDKLGNTENATSAELATCVPCTDAVGFDVDKTPPVIDRVRPGDALIYSAAGEGNPVAVHIRVSDNESGVDWDNTDNGNGANGAFDDEVTVIDLDNELGGFTLPPSPDGVCSINSGATDAEDSQEVTEIYCTGLDLPANDGDGSAEIMIGDQAGNIAAVENTDYVVDNTPPTVSLTTVAPPSVNALNLAAVDLTFAGTATDANGLSGGTAEGYLDGGDGVCNGVDEIAFTAPDANIDEIDLGTGPNFSFTFTVFEKNPGAGVATRYCILKAFEDNATEADGSGGANTSASWTGHDVYWDGM